MATINEARARFDRALDLRVAAENDLVTAALHLLCLRIKAEHRTAETVVFDWSDQGDWLNAVHVLDADGEELEWDDPDCLATNFEGHVESVWLPFMAPLADGEIRKPTDLFHLPIAKTIAHFNRQESPR